SSTSSPSGVVIDINRVVVLDMAHPRPDPACPTDHRAGGRPFDFRKDGVSDSRGERPFLLAWTEGRRYRLLDDRGADRVCRFHSLLLYAQAEGLAASADTCSNDGGPDSEQAVEWSYRVQPGEEGSRRAVRSGPAAVVRASWLLLGVTGLFFRISWG